MNIQNYKLIICEQNYDMADGEINITSSKEIAVQEGELRIKDEIKNIFDHKMFLYETKEINEFTTWYFLQCEDTSKNLYAQVISVLTNE